jgi:uncharacterized protein (TIGR00730 family)
MTAVSTPAAKMVPRRARSFIPEILSFSNSRPVQGLSRLGSAGLTGSAGHSHIGSMSEIHTICVYCGSGPGSDPAFVAAARDFGREMARHGIRLVYGGGSLGLMGALAESVVDHGGDVVGVIPEFLKGREKMFTRAQETIVTRDMHERKQIMFDRADAFVALPGGIGTLEETIEQMTWAQLGRHKKPILLANIAGFWNPLCALLDHMRELAFIRPGLMVEPLVADRIEDVIPMLQAAVAPVPEPAKAGAPETIERM